MSIDKELAGRVAIVTGAGRNIGRAIALALAAGGAAVTVNARGNSREAEAVAAEIAAAGGKALTVLGDVASEADVARLAAQTAERFGRIDILVNNAAVRPEQRFESMTLTAWRSVLAVDLDGAFLTVKACLPELRKSGAGAVVNIGGLTGHTGAKGRAHVVTAKAGLVGFTKALAHDLAEYGITANCVVPGLIDTTRDAGAVLPPDHAVSRTLAGRFGTSEEIAAAVRYLAGPRARYVTGQTLHLNGGAYLG